MRIGQPLPLLTDDQAELAEHVAGNALEQLGPLEPGVVAETVALLLCAVLHPLVTHNPNVADQLALTLLNDVVRRVDAHTAAATALVKAMTASKRR
jgi:hypothetical protein